MDRAVEERVEEEESMDDLISRKAAIDAVHEEFDECLVWDESGKCTADEVERIIEALPSAQPEPFTDKEQMIFLAAMEREMKICEEMDRNYARKPYEESLVSVCKKIERKVKGALWI